MKAPNFLGDFNPEVFDYLGGSFETPKAGSAGWHHTEDGNILPWQILGDIKDSDHIAFVHHGGPGDATKQTHIAPFLGIDGLVVFAYNQRLSGTGELRSMFEGSGDPLETHTPELLVQDAEDMRATILDGKNISPIGGSWGAALALLQAEANPEATNSVGVWSVTLARQLETLNRYQRNGSLHTAVPKEFERFIELTPESSRNDPSRIITHYDSGMNPFLDNHEEEHAKDLAIAFGLLHLSAADPEGIGGMGLAELPSDQLHPLAEAMGIKPDLYARVAMNFFAKHVPRIGQGRGQIIDTIGNLKGKSLHIVSGGSDPLTPPYATEELETEATKVGVNVRRELVEQGHHDRSHAPMQEAIRKGALWLFSEN